MADQYQVRKLTGAGILGTYTKKQIADLWDKGKLGGTDSVLYQGEWILLSDFENRIKQVAEQEINQLAEEKANEEGRVRAEREKEERKRREEEQREEDDHRREIERIQAESASKAGPGMRRDRHSPGGAQNPEAPPPFPDSDAAKLPKEKKIPTGAASGGGGIFLVIILAVLWHQGYWDPADLKALIGQSKYISVARDTKLEGMTLEELFPRRIRDLTWESKRGFKRTEILIICKGTVTNPKSGKTSSIHITWEVDKTKKTKNLGPMLLNNAPLTPKDKLFVFVYLTSDPNDD